MKIFSVVLALVLLIGCGKKSENSDAQAGSATQTGISEVLSATSGYIIEDARLIVKDNDPAVMNLSGALKLGAGKTSVMVIRGTSGDNSVSSILALQFPGFSAGTMAEFDGSSELAQFILYGMQNGQQVVKESGLISGSLRCVKTSPSTLNLGLNREIIEGSGTMEVIISNIQPGVFKYSSMKKYNAQFSFPIVKLGEMARLSTPS